MLRVVRFNSILCGLCVNFGIMLCIVRFKFGKLWFMFCLENKEIFTRLTDQHQVDISQKGAIRVRNCE